MAYNKKIVPYLARKGNPALEFTANYIFNPEYSRKVLSVA